MSMYGMNCCMHWVEAQPSAARRARVHFNVSYKLITQYLLNDTLAFHSEWFFCAYDAF